MDDDHKNFMADIIASGTNTIATFTNEECSQAHMYLNIPPNEDAAAPVMDTIVNIGDNSRNNEESLVNKSNESATCRLQPPHQKRQREGYRMHLPGPTSLVGTRIDYSVGPWDYSACATRHLMAWGARTSVEKYSDRKLYMFCTM
jgi:hypothetical protein